MIALFICGLFWSVSHAEPLPGTFSVAPDPQDTIDQTRSQERNILDELAMIDQDLEAVAAEVATLQERRDELTQRQQTLQLNLDEAEANLVEHRAAIAGWVRALYFLHRRGLARIIFGAEAPHTIRQRSTYLMAIISADAQRFDDFAAATTRKRQTLANLDSGMAELTSLGAELQLKEADLKEQRARKLELLTEIRSQRALALSVMQELNQTRGAMNRGSWASEMWGGSRNPSTGNPSTGNPNTGNPNTGNPNTGNGSFGLGSNWGAAEQPRCNNAGSFRAAYGRLPWPTEGALLRPFGAYTDSRTNQREQNDGLDITGRFGTPVRAVYGGTVSIAQYMRLYGYTVAIEHGAYTTVYAHLNGLQVQVGEEVCAGDPIGSIGDSGLTDGNGGMLEFQIRYNNTPQDPIPWLQQR